VLVVAALLAVVVDVLAFDVDVEEPCDAATSCWMMLDRVWMSLP
jgi:hypothetical protein